MELPSKNVQNMELLEFVTQWHGVPAKPPLFLWHLIKRIAVASGIVIVSLCGDRGCGMDVAIASRSLLTARNLSARLGSTLRR